MLKNFDELFIFIDECILLYRNNAYLRVLIPKLTVMDVNEKMVNKVLKHIEDMDDDNQIDFAVELIIEIVLHCGTTYAEAMGIIECAKIQLHQDFIKECQSHEFGNN